MTREEIQIRKEEARKAQRRAGALFAVALLACAMWFVMLYHWYSAMIRLGESARQENPQMVQKEEQ